MLGALGAPEDVDQAAWAAYLRNLRDGVASSWNTVRAAYQKLERVRSSFGLPLLARPGEASSPGALTPGEQQDFFDVGATSHLLVTWMDEVLADKRKVGRNNGELVIESLPGDQVRIVLQAGRPRIVSASTGQPVPVTPVDGALPGQLGYVAWVAVAAVAVAVAAYLINQEQCETEVRVAEQKTMETIATKQSELVQSGKATPEQAKKMTDAIYQGAASVEQARGEAKEREGESGLQKTVRTLAWVSLGIGAVYLATRIIPSTPVRAAA
jgi:hypothetical protein